VSLLAGASAIPGVTVDFASLAQVRQWCQRSTRKHRGQQPMAGNFFSRYKGRGMDFAEVRAYQAGDDIRSIDWRVTARTGKAHTKLFHQERERPLWLWVDQRPSMYFGSRQCFKSVLACQLAAFYAWQALSLGDKIGSVVFNDQDLRLHRPVGQQRSLQALFANLIEFNQQLLPAIPSTQPLKQPLIQQQPTPHASNTISDQNNHLATALRALLHHLHKQSFVVLISDFSEWDSACPALLQAIASRCHLICHFIADPLEQNLPSKAQGWITQGTEFLSLPSLGKAERQAFTEQFLQRQQAVQHSLYGSTSSFLPCLTSTPIEQWSRQLVA
jgi:uncharacterized protein (DUF58 family)